MSARQLRRLQQLEEQKKLEESQTKKQVEVEEEEEEEEEDEEPLKKAKVNLFALLGGEEEEDEEEDEESEPGVSKEKEIKKEEKSVLLESRESKKVDIPQIVNGNSSDDDEVFQDAVEAIKPYKTKKKNKKKKNKKKKSAITTNTDTANPQRTVTLEAEEDEEYNYFFNANSRGDYIDSGVIHFPLSDFVSSLPLLQFSVRDLDPDNEYKKLFGHISSKVLNEADSTTSSFVSPEILAQIKQLSKKIPGWGGKDRRSIPGSVRKLTLTKIKDDWIPTRQKNITMKEVPISEMTELKMLKESKNAWDNEKVKKETEEEMNIVGLKYFKFANNINETLLNSQFLLSVVIRPDHESLIKLLQHNPYHVESILQVSNILVRQGDKSNNSGLIERALFVFDRAFKNNFSLGNGLCQLPYDYFLNRQFYLAIFKYVNVLTQKGTFFTALAFCKLLFSFDPKEDPLGVRYFIDFYCIMAMEYQYLIDLFNSRLIQSYKTWMTPGIVFSTALAYLKLGDIAKSKEVLKIGFNQYPYLALQLLETVGKTPIDQISNTKLMNEIYRNHINRSIKLVNQTYLVRVGSLWKDLDDVDFLTKELLNFVNSSDLNLSNLPDYSEDYTKIPVNLLRYAVLAGDSSVMAKLPTEFWDDNSIYEFDVLPPNTIATEVFENMVDHNFLSQALIQATDDDLIQQLEAMG